MKIQMSNWDFIIWLMGLAGVVIFILLVIYYFLLRDKGRSQIRK